MRFGPLNEVGNDEEVTRKLHIDDGFQLEIQAFLIARALLFAFVGIFIQLQQAGFQALVRGVAKVLRLVHLLPIHGRHRVVRQARLTQGQSHRAALGDFYAIGQRTGQIGKARLHLGTAGQALLGAKALDALGVAQQFAIGNADPCLVRFKVCGF